VSAGLVSIVLVLVLVLVFVLVLVLVVVVLVIPLVVVVVVVVGLGTGRGLSGLRSEEWSKRMVGKFAIHHQAGSLWYFTPSRRHCGCTAIASGWL
jgi:hypothetical protein